MSSLTEDQSRTYMHKLLAAMVQGGGSELFIAADFPPSMNAHGSMQPMTAKNLNAETTRMLAQAMMNPRQREEFATEMECNFAISLPEVLKDVVMNKRGLVLVVGATGSGKSTTLAAMIDHRNRTSADHIITVEDPVEYVHLSRKSLVTHREVGVDTHSWHHALKNTLRQAPDVILIGEVRDTETMEHAIAFAETGHLCLGTLHANSASRTIERIINFFPEERRAQLLMDLSANLRAIVSQRLVRAEDGNGRAAAIEILLNTPTIAERILQGDLTELKSIMNRSRELGMRTFDWALFELYNAGLIDEALRNADSANELRLNIKLKSERGEPEASAFMSLALEPVKLTPEQIEAQRVEEPQQQAQTRKRLEDEAVRQRLLQGAGGGGGAARG